MFTRSLVTAAVLALPFTTFHAPSPAGAAEHAAVAARRGPPWISVEYPPSPYDRTTRGAFLLVHAFHHGTPADFPVRGTAEGLVDGKRRTVALRFEKTSRTGVFAVRKQWPDEGRWVLSLGVEQGSTVAGALVVIGADGTVASVRVPTGRIAGYDSDVPRAISTREIEQALARGD